MADPSLDSDTIIERVETIVKPGITNDKVMDLYTTWAETYDKVRDCNYRYIY